MPNNLSERIRECDEQAVHCARQADAQTDPGVKRQFLELKRLWLLLARGLSVRELSVTVNASYRDKGCEISRKHGNALVGRLRTSYGGGFAQGCANDDKLSDVLAKLDERSLYKLVRDYKSGMLPIRLRTPWIIAPQP
jgi:hypothetical protein